MHPPTADPHTSPPFKTDHSDRRADLPILSPVDPILEAALAYHEQGFCVLPVMKDKTPYIKWEKEFKERWQREGQTIEDVTYLFDSPQVPRYGIAILTYPYSPVVALDFDGPHGVSTWEKTGITLPETATNSSASGFPHLFFCPPQSANGLKRAVRLVQEETSCGWKGKRCGVDLICNGYIVVPPTPGYKEDPDRPFGRFAELPAEVVTLVQKADRTTTTSRTKSPTEAVITHGQRNDTLASLAGTMRRRGMDEAEILAGLLEVNTRRCQPPLPESEVGDIAQSVSRYEPAHEVVSVRPEHLTDLGNARRFVTMHRGNVRFCYPWSKWSVWMDTHWAVDDTGEIYRCAKETVRGIYREADQCEDESRRPTLAKHAAKCESEGKLNAMLAMAQSEPGIPVLPDDLDRDPWLLNVRNGTLDLKTGQLRPHRREDLITKCLPVAYDPQAQCPRWCAFLDRIFEAKQELIAYVQRAIGYSLTGDTSEHCIFMLYGPGENGKSTQLQTLLGLLDAYAKKTPTETLMVRRGESIPNDVARLRGARLVVAVEAEAGRRLAEAMVKEVTGGDTIAARFMRQEWFEFVPQFKIWLATNHKPRILGTDRAIWRRIRLIPFTVIIPKAEQDRQLGEKLREEWPGILAWAVEGCRAWQAHGLGEPQEVIQATEEYRAEQDVIGAFLEECCYEDSTASALARDLYGAYRAWTEANGERLTTQKDFGGRLGERGFTRGTGAGNVKKWFGIGLVEK